MLTLLTNAINTLGQYGNAADMHDVDPGTRIMALARTITHDMVELEKEQMKSIHVCHKYGHFFFSLLAMFELLVRIALSLSIVLIGYVFYAIVNCISCGDMPVWKWLKNRQYICSMYLYLCSKVFSNLCFPYAPSAYSFHNKKETLSRPHIRGVTSTKEELHGLQDSIESGLTQIGACLCCGACIICCHSCNTPDTKYHKPNLPWYKIMQTFLISYGGCNAFKFGYCCGNEQTYESFINDLMDEAEKENIEATTAYYNTKYRVANFTELVHQQLYIDASQIEVILNSNSSHPVNTSASYHSIPIASQVMSDVTTTTVVNAKA